MELQTSSFDLVKLTYDVKVVLREKYKDREIEIDSHEGIMIYADRTMIEIVLKNLIENALKYSDNKVVIKIEKERISIIDQGMGISQDKLKKVTKKFYRTGEHDWDNSMGLGLSIVKNILKMHGLKLEIESQEDRGSTFSFDFHNRPQNLKIEGD